MVVFQACGDFQGILLRGASRSASYGRKKRIHGLKSRRLLKEGGPVFAFLWGKKFQRVKGRGTTADEIEDFHLKFLVRGIGLQRIAYGRQLARPWPVYGRRFMRQFCFTISI